MSEMCQFKNRPGLVEELVEAGVKYIDQGETVLVEPLDSRQELGASCMKCGCAWATVWSAENGETYTDGCLNEDCENAISVLYEVSLYSIA